MIVLRVLAIGCEIQVVGWCNVSRYAATSCLASYGLADAVWVYL